MSRLLALDAMGVIYKAADDVAELLVPFVMTHKGIDAAVDIEAAYMMASRGEISAPDFWYKVGLDPSVEDEYLDGHCLSDGLLEFLTGARHVHGCIVCLSNDVSEWSIKLRKRFDLERYISDWFISGDLHVRKPAVEIYQHLISAVSLDPADVLFVDDRPKNLLPAQTLGISCVLFDPNGVEENSEFPVARAFADLSGMLPVA